MFKWRRNTNTGLIVAIAFGLTVITGYEAHRAVKMDASMYETVSMAVTYVLTIGAFILMTFCVYEEDRAEYYRKSERIERLMLIHMFFFSGLVLTCTIWCNIEESFYDDSRLMLFATIRTLCYIFLSDVYVIYVKSQVKANESVNQPNWMLTLYGMMNLLSTISIVIVIINTWTGILFTAENGKIITTGVSFIVALFPLMAVITNALYVYLPGNQNMVARGTYVLVAIIILVGSIMYGISQYIIFLNVIMAMSMLIIYIRIHMQLRYDVAMRHAELADARQDMMLTQIQPHFIFNALNTIYQLCGEDIDTARQAIDDFSSYLRVNLNSLTENRRVSFTDELRHVETYARLERLRFGDKLRIIYDIRETDFMLPPLSVQPMVENAIKHGVCEREGGGYVRISTERGPGGYIVEIRDNGVGFDIDEMRNDGRVHVGIDNVERRIEEICGGELNITSSPGEGTKVFMFIPDSE